MGDADYHAIEPIRCGIREHQTGSERSYRTPQFSILVLFSGSAWVSEEGQASQAVAAGAAWLRRPEMGQRVAYAAGSISGYVATPAAQVTLLRAVGVAIDGPQIAALDLDARESAQLRRRFAQVSARVARASLGHPLSALIAASELQAEVLMHRGTAGTDPWLRRAQALLVADFGQAIPEVARRMGESYDGFRRRFRRLGGTAPAVWRAEARIRQARAMLANSADGLAAIAAALGYADRTAFHHDFQRRTGTTPARWRRHQDI